LADQPGIVAELARDELADIIRLTAAIDTLTKRIGERVRLVAPSLVAMPGCGELTAAKIVGEVAVVTRFGSAVRRLRRCHTGPALVRGPRALPGTSPAGEPTAQQGPARDRSDSVPLWAPGKGLLPEAN
jgi:hypothetical protein